jgi:DNA ligase-1
MGVTLFKKDALNRVKKWEISGAMKGKVFVITTVTGIVDMKMTTYEKLVSAGKNIGKSNETTVEEQGHIVMNTMVNKKRDEGYHETVKKTNNPLPMLALEFSKRKHDISYPAYIQPKLDGVRALFNPIEGYLYSRKGKIFPNLDFITTELQEKGITIPLDGELYSDELSFQDITGIVKKEKLTTQDVKKLYKVKFIVFDYINEKMDFQGRKEILQKTLQKLKYTTLLDSKSVYNESDIHAAHVEYTSKGYEGIMVRNYKGFYAINKRSKDLQKLKFFETEEFKIIDGISGTGTEKDCVIWVCEGAKGAIFTVRPVGSFEERKKMLKNKSAYIGKMLTVKFQNYTSGKDGKSSGIPRFPIGIAVRDYE